MKKHLYHRAVSAAVAGVLLCTALVGCSPEFLNDGIETEGSGMPGETYPYSVDMDPYEDAVYTTDEDYLLLANKESVLGEDYAPDQLLSMDSRLTLYGKSIQLEAKAAKAAELLIRELHINGYTDIYITSGYRTYAYQQSLFNQYVTEERAKHPAWTQAQIEAEVLTYSAKPGTSEHQTGLCMDLISDQNVVLDETFANNPAYAWLCENAHHFGFILRYPDDKTDITGYSYEPWHYRFVGLKAATEIHTRGITLEEYLQDR